MLLERAFALIDDLKSARIPTDAAVWNALVTAAGRAGQLQRAFNVLEDMLGSGTRPNDWTYASLIDACARAGDKALALRVRLGRLAGWEAGMGGCRKEAQLDRVGTHSQQLTAKCSMGL